MSKVKIEFEPQDAIAELVEEIIITGAELNEKSDDVAIFTDAVIKLFAKEFNIKVEKDTSEGDQDA